MAVGGKGGLFEAEIKGDEKSRSNRGAGWCVLTSEPAYEVPVNKIEAKKGTAEESGADAVNRMRLGW